MPEFVVEIPTFHPGQNKVYQERGKFNAVRCGRRWGKTKMMVALAANAAAKGLKAGLFTPEHKQLHEPYDELLFTLRDIKRRASKQDGILRTVTNGALDFWALTDNELAGRGREYDELLIDEAAYTKNGQMMDIWERSIVPTILTRPKARAWVFSTPNGDDPDNFFWKICNDPDTRFKEHYAPSASNPLVTAAELARHKKSSHPDVFRQEYLAEFVDWRGTAFFLTEKLLHEGRPIFYPSSCELVGAVIDSAIKTGTDNDGTAVLYFAQMPTWFTDYRVVLLDWDIITVKGALLEEWIPNVFTRLQELAALTKAVNGSIGAGIEDAASGSILLQQCELRYPGMTYALPQKLTSVGKDGRALNASGPVWRGEVKYSSTAYEKVVTYKGATRNHLHQQVVGYRMGDKDAARRADDLLDVFTYTVALTCGNQLGIA